MVVGFERAGMEVVAAVETEDAPLRCEDRPRSMASRVLEDSADYHIVRLLCKVFSEPFGDEGENRETIGEGFKCVWVSRLALIDFDYYCRR